MRTVYVDLSKDDSLCRDKIYVGYTGEHNATELVIAVPRTMADESDYLVAVFLADGKIVRSERIKREAETGKPYLDDDQIHILLSRRLTRFPLLGLQVECYRKNDKGVSVLLGKTQFVPNLEFRLSPEGERDCSGTVDPEELYDLLDWWRNREEDDEHHDDDPDEDSKGVKKYASFDELPADAEDGDLAYVASDGGEITEPVEFMKSYKKIQVRDDFDKEAFSALPVIEEYIEEGAEEISRQASLSFRDNEKREICFAGLLYYGEIGSLLALTDFMCEDDRSRYYPPDSEYRYEPVYMFVSGEGDIGPLLFEDYDEEEMTPVPVTRGWYRMSYYISEYYIDNDRVESRDSYRFEPIDKKDILPLKTLSNCYLRLDSELQPYASQISSVISACFDVFGEDYHPKGLYLFENGEWTPQKSLPVITAADRAHFPVAAEDGQISISGSDAYILNHNSGYMYVGGTWDRLCVNPVPGRDAFLCDCRVKCRYGYRSQEDGNIHYFDSNAGLDLIVDAQSGYALLSISTSPWDYYRTYWLYSKNTGSVTIPSGSVIGNAYPQTFSVREGWSKIRMSDGQYTCEEIDPFNELPDINFTGYNQSYLMEITEYDCILRSQYFITNMPFFESDNGKGVWYFSSGTWRNPDAKTGKI